MRIVERFLCTAPSTPSINEPAPRHVQREVYHAHPGWDLPPHITQMMSMPVHQALTHLLPPPPYGYGSGNGTTANGAPASNAFMDAMRATINLTTTENGALAYKSTESPLVDLFFDLAPLVGAEHLYKLLAKAWAVDPEGTMKIILHARSIHEGKGYQDGFYRAMAWVYEYHPHTFLTNLHLIVKPTCERQRDKERDNRMNEKKMDKAVKENMGVMDIDDDKQYPARPHGSFDDLNNILILYINGQFKTSYTGPLNAVNQSLAPTGQRHLMKTIRLRARGVPAPPQKAGGKRGAKVQLTENDPRKAVWEAKTKQVKARLVRHRFDVAISQDTKFQALYLVIADLFATQLKKDLQLYRQSRYSAPKATEIFGLSYAAKWAVTPGKGTDKQLLIASATALKLFPGDGVKSARERLQREYLSPLRSMLNVPEVKMSAGEWAKVEYNKVPSRSMTRNAPYFKAHDRTGFKSYLLKVATGQTTISGASRFPHEILIDAMGDDDLKTEIADLQWKALVQSIRNSSTSSLKNCLAIADVSGSMTFDYNAHRGLGDPTMPRPIHPCIALTLLMSELSVTPWRGSFFTFSSKPTMEYIDPARPLSQRAKELSQAHWRNSTNLHAVFKLILSSAQRAKLPPADMISTLFVFSDMQFNKCGGEVFHEAIYQVIKNEFEVAGYKIPELVFWNLAARVGGTPKPVTAGQSGVSLMSGYSGSLMKYFLGRPANEDENIAKEDDPLETVKKVIAAPSFSGIKIAD